VDISVILAILSGIGTSLAYWDYNREVRKGGTKPNGATWAIWSTISLVSTYSYLTSTGDFWKGIPSLLNILFCLGTFFRALAIGKFKTLDTSDWCALTVGIIAALVCKLVNASYGNLVVQVAVIIGFIPTWRGVAKTPACEKPRPWWIWCAAYGIATIVVILRWKNQWVDIVYPLLCTILHASVPLVGIVARRKQSTKTNGGIRCQ
jgi:hypothetical protein